MADEISGGWRAPQDRGSGDPAPSSRRWPAGLPGRPARPPRRPARLARRHLALLGVLAVLFGYVVTHRAPAPPPRASRSATASHRPALPLTPSLGGRVSTGPAGLRLLVPGSSPRVVDAATGAVASPPGIRLAPGAGVTAFPVGRSTIGVVGYVLNAGFYLLLPGAEPMVLGRESAVSPSSDGQLIVVMSAPDQTVVFGVALDRRVRWEWRSPDTLVALHDAPSGLLLQRFGQRAGDRDLVLVDRRTGALLRVLARDVAAVAAGDRAAAWLPADCAQSCPLAVGDLGSGRRRDYPLPEGRAPDSGAFSPDGRLLALTFPALDDGDPVRPGYVGVLDLRTGALAVVPQLHTAELGAAVAWSPDSRWLVIGVRWPDHQTIAIWELRGDLRILPTYLPGRTGAPAVLP